jgi:ADP-ribose pyrophosphatase YjhB (NUDIX family)
MTESNSKTSLIDKLAYLYLRNNQVLVSLTRGKDKWYIPGGKRESGESDQQALRREVKEELSVELRPDTIEYYGTFTAQAHDKPQGVMVQMACYFAEFKGELKPDNEIAALDFFSYQQKEQTGYVDQLIFEQLFEDGLLK